MKRCGKNHHSKYNGWLAQQLSFVPYWRYMTEYNNRTPDWVKNAVFYQIFIDRFSIGDNLIKTTGYLENFNYSQIFIKNETGCLEIIHINLIVNMKQIKE